MNNQARGTLTVTDLEETWTYIQRMVTRFLNVLDGQQKLNMEEYAKVYSVIHNMCAEHRNADEVYYRYKGFFKEYFDTVVIPAMREKDDEFMLREFVQRWDSHKIMLRPIGGLFRYLERYLLRWMPLPKVDETGIISFRDLVYPQIKIKCKDAMISLIYREREGGQIDRALLREVLDNILEIHGGSVDAYDADFEVEILTDTTAYYSKKAASWREADSVPAYMVKAEECILKEQERAGHYLHASSGPKLLERVRHELLSQFEKLLLEKKRSTGNALLREFDVVNLSRMSTTFPQGQKRIAAMFRQHVIDEGATLVKQAEGAALKRKAENMDNDVRMLFVRKVIKLHNKYSQYVSICFSHVVLFNCALEEAFDVFFSKGVSGSNGAKLLAMFSVHILKKWGSDGATDEALEDSLETVAKVLACLGEKDLFAEFYLKKLAHRLLFDKSANHSHEISAVVKLKHRCGTKFTSTMEAMINDLAVARENQISFENFLNENSALNPGFDLSVTVLTSRHWPTFKSPDLSLPSDMVKCVDVFRNFYQETRKERKLTWNHSLGTCLLIGRFEPKPIEISMTTCQAAVLLLFNDASHLSYVDIKGQLNMTKGNIDRLLHSLSCAEYKILNKDPATNVITPKDTFEFNHLFSNKLGSIEITPTPRDERKKPVHSVDADRGHTIDASIIRILKHRKILPQDKVVHECREQLKGILKPDLNAMKRRIEGLIEREYLERDNDSHSLLKYLP